MTHGGAREGAGRPALPVKRKRIKVAYTIDPTVAKWIDRWRVNQSAAEGLDRPLSMSIAIERLILAGIESLTKQAKKKKRS